MRRIAPHRSGTDRAGAAARLWCRTVRMREVCSLSPLLLCGKVVFGEGGWKEDGDGM